MRVKDLAELSPEIFSKYREIFSLKNEDATLPTTNITNYCAIYGSLPGENVSAVSSLADEFHQLMLLMSLNLR